MFKLTLAALAGITLTLATPVYAARGGGGAAVNMATSGLGQVATRIASCRHLRCDSSGGCVRRPPCRMRKGWFAEGLDPLIR